MMLMCDQTNQQLRLTQDGEQQQQQQQQAAFHQNNNDKQRSVEEAHTIGDM